MSEIANHARGHVAPPGAQHRALLHYECMTN
jgi:hypothetical protein